MNWGKSITLFFVVFIGAMLTFVVFSLRQRNDLVTDDYYEKGAGYSKQMVINQRSAPYADSVTITTLDSTIQLTMTKTMVHLCKRCNVKLYRPSNKQLDVEQTFTPDSCVSILNGLTLNYGRYIARFEWVVNDSVYQIEKEIFIK